MSITGDCPYFSDVMIFDRLKSPALGDAYYGYTVYSRTPTRYRMMAIFQVVSHPYQGAVLAHELGHYAGHMKETIKSPITHSSTMNRIMFSPAVFPEGIGKDDYPERIAEHKEVNQCMCDLYQNGMGDPWELIEYPENTGNMIWEWKKVPGCFVFNSGKDVP